jgi:glycine cleavage system aminomethyltransferase T
MESNTSSSGVQRYPLGKEPVCKPDGTVLQDRNGRRSFVTTASTGVSVGKHLLMAYLPVEEAVVGTRLAVEYIGELYPVTVAAVGAAAVFDPENTRMRG